MNPFYNTLFGALALAGLAACTSPQAPSSEALAYLSDTRLGHQVDQLCIEAEGYDFRDMTDRTVIIETAGQEFLVETSDQCSHLPNARNLYAHSERKDSRCIGARNLLVAESPFAFSPQIPSESRSGRCHIKAIYEWDEDATNAQLAQLR